MIRSQFIFSLVVGAALMAAVAGGAAMVLGVLLGVTLFIWRAIDDEPSPQLREKVVGLEDMRCHVCGARFTAEEPLAYVVFECIRFDEVGDLLHLDEDLLVYACETTCLPQVRERIRQALPADLQPGTYKADAMFDPVA